MESPLVADTDLLLLALRYVAGEFSPAEASAFERRLDEDQAAREAVADAVALAGAIAGQTARVLPHSSHRRTIKLVAGLALAAAASLAWFLILPGGTAGRGDRLTARGNKPSETVTLAWSILRQDRSFDPEIDPGNHLLALNDESRLLGQREMGLATEFETETEFGDTSDLGPSGWLVEAASLAGSTRPAAPTPQEN
jgi:hypothetical protein